MSLKDVAQQSPPVTRRAAFPWRLRDSLSPEDFGGLMSLLDNPAWSATALVALLKREGINVSTSTIRAYRRGEVPDPDVEA